MSEKSGIKGKTKNVEQGFPARVCRAVMPSSPKKGGGSYGLHILDDVFDYVILYRNSHKKITPSFAKALS